jgi:hypothetical protein
MQAFGAPVQHRSVFGQEDLSHVRRFLGDEINRADRLVAQIGLPLVVARGLSERIVHAERPIE